MTFLWVSLFYLRVTSQVLNEDVEALLHSWEDSGGHIRRMCIFLIESMIEEKCIFTANEEGILARDRSKADRMREILIEKTYKMFSALYPNDYRDIDTVEEVNYSEQLAEKMVEE